MCLFTSQMAALARWKPGAGSFILVYPRGSYRVPPQAYFDLTRKRKRASTRELPVTDLLSTYPHVRSWELEVVSHGTEGEGQEPQNVSHHRCLP